MDNRFALLVAEIERAATFATSDAMAETFGRLLDFAARLPAPAGPEPIPMLLFCPACGTQHIDAPDPSEGWTNPPHRSHTCRKVDGGCGHIWRPADVQTTGVAAIQTRGSVDSPVVVPRRFPPPSTPTSSPAHDNREWFAERERNAWFPPTPTNSPAEPQRRPQAWCTFHQDCKRPPHSPKEGCQTTGSPDLVRQHEDYMAGREPMPAGTVVLGSLPTSTPAERAGIKVPGGRYGPVPHSVTGEVMWTHTEATSSPAGEPKAQAGEWEPHPHHSVRQYPSGYTGGFVDNRGWFVWDGISAVPLASGPETGDLGMCLADLSLCAEGHLDVTRIAFGTDAMERVVFRAIISSGGDLTPSSLPAVLAAVRGAR